MKQRTKKWTAIGELAGNVIARLDTVRAAAADRACPKENAGAAKAPASERTDTREVADDAVNGEARQNRSNRSSRLIQTPGDMPKALPAGRYRRTANPSPTGAIPHAAVRLYLAANDNHARSLSEVRT